MVHVNMKSSYLFVVRQVRIYCVHCSLCLLPGDGSCNDGGKKTTAVSHQHNLLGSGQIIQQLILDRLRCDVVARPQNNQVLDAPDDAPVPCRVDLALIAGMKPAVAQGFGSLRGTVPVSRKNIRPRTINSSFSPSFISILLIAGPTRPGSTRRGSSIVQIAVVSVRP